MKSKIHKKDQKTKPSLDKLAQLVPFAPVVNPKNTVQTLGKRAKAKYFTNSYTKKLATLKSPLQKSYNNTVYGCSNLLTQTGNKLTSHYCNNRWCVVCNRIRTAKQINGYKPPLEKLNDKQFVTLTIPNVSGETLRETIKDMTKTFQNIMKQFHKKKISFVGLRKLECTYNDKQNNFHPHFHCIIEGKEIAGLLLNEWLKRYLSSVKEAQHIRPADDGSILEMFKYFAKILTDGVVYVNALDVIFQAMRNLRVYQPFGIHKVSEEIEELQAQTIEDLKKAEKSWSWIDNDWVDKTTGEMLTGYEPDDTMKRIIKNIK